MRRAIGVFRKTARCLAGIVALAGIGLSLPGAVKADTYDVSVWLDTAAASTAVVGGQPGTAANVTFTLTSTTGINFELGVGGPQANATVAQWLASVVGGTVSNVAYNGATSSSPFTISGNITDGAFVQFTGTMGLTGGVSSSFTVTHDDGASLSIGGTPVFSAPGPTSAETSTGSYTPGGSGPVDPSFTLAYGEVNGTPAIIDLAVPQEHVAAVPEPSTLAIAGLGALGFGAYHYRRRRARKASA